MIRADDLGYSKAVNYGIYESVKHGLIQNIGFMVNMPASLHGFELVKNLDICLGQHTNVCLGKPISDPKKIPSLVQVDGTFKTSRMYRNSKEDFVVLEEAILEIEMQYQRFKEITGSKPHYFEAHAVQSKHLMDAIDIVGKRHGLKTVGISLDGTPVMVNGKKMYMHLKSMDPEYDPLQCFLDMIANTHEDGYDMMICHPGYIDEELLHSSSLTTPRVKEVTMLTNQKLKEWIKQKEIHLYTYDEI